MFVAWEKRYGIRFSCKPDLDLVEKEVTYQRRQVTLVLQPLC